MYIRGESSRRQDKHNPTDRQASREADPSASSRNRSAPQKAWLLLLCPLAALAQTTTPDCPRLEQWSAKLEPGKTFSITPKLELTTLLSDELTTPLFGSPGRTWSTERLSEIGAELQQCRRAAAKRKDKQAANDLYKAMKELRTASKSLFRVERARVTADRDVQLLVDQPPTPGLSNLIALAQQALRGVDVQQELRSNRSFGPIGGNVANLQRAYDSLPEKDREALIARLGERGESANSEQQSIDQEWAEARQALAGVPADAQGLQTLQRLVQLPILDKVDRNEARAYRDAIQKKRWAIQSSLQKQQAQQAAAEAARPIDLIARLEALFSGDRVDTASLGGLQPGMPYSQAANTLERDWHFEGEFPPTGSPTKYAGTRQEWPRFKSERRNGGIVELAKLDDGQIGQITYTELYKAMVIDAVARNWLIQRFGEPDDMQASSESHLMSWNAGSRRLQVSLSHQLDMFDRSAGYKSQLAIAVWNEAYEDFLQAQNARCDEIRKIPRNEMSIEQSVWFFPNCPLGPGHHDTAGL
ncbi:hypothetical protein [Sedimenticola selenatireducens]|uniref:hypothetical protein n=1 Tax=Sedimenticola selenatireducens TaxID=191960 RepID=UPI002AAB89B2|nr:hypothetical protein [Sedimenticola selenatireducens]